MSTSKETKKKSATPYFIAGLLIFVAISIITAFVNSVQNQDLSHLTEDIGRQATERLESNMTEAAAAEPESGTDDPAKATNSSTIDVKAALSSRILGNPDAPIKISEHSSFTCGHCQHFHLNTFEKFKEAYIDTGKAYLVFSDFPLNAPALHASMVARCLPHDRYFSFVQTLFKKQDEWASDGNKYMEILKNMAKENGLSNSEFEACIESKDLQDGILGRMKASQTQWGINSTPSFVVNNQDIISGALPFEEFDKRIQEALSAEAGKDSK